MSCYWLLLLLIPVLAVIPATVKYWGTDGFGGPL